MNKDKYGEIINGNETYKQIAQNLINGCDVIIGWTDEGCDHRDIYFSLEQTKVFGNIQRGIKMNDLFVGIIPYSFFGFKINDIKHPNYIFEKLGLNGSDTDYKIAELINGVIKEIGEIDD